MFNKKILLTISAGLIVAILVTTNFAAAADLNQAVSTLGQDDEWSIMAHAALGQSAGQSFLAQPINDNTATDYEKRILAAVAAGFNPATVSSENFVAKLKSMFDGNQLGDPELINDDIFGILAFQAAGDDSNIIAAARQFILNHQNSDGGWGFAVGQTSDSNTTAMAVAALSISGSAPSSAFAYLQQSQDSSGGYGFAPGQPADGASTAWVISGLISADQSVPAGAKNFLENLQLPAGSFKWHPADAAGSPLVTAYAVIALSGRSLPLIGQVADEPPRTGTPTPTPTPPIITPTPAGPISRHINSIAPIHAAAGTWVTISGTDLSDAWRGSTTIQFFNTAGSRATYIGSLESDLTISRFQIPATLPPGRYTVKVGPNLDDVSNALPFTVDKISVPGAPSPTPTPRSAGSNIIETDCMVPIYHTNFPLNGGTVVTVNGQLYYVKSYLAQCQNITAASVPTAPPKTSPQTNPPPRPTPTPTPAPAPIQIVALSVRYNSTNIFSGSIPYSSQSALSLLRQAGSTHGFGVATSSTALGQFVSAIAGIGPKGASGWQYAVNGSVPAVSAADYTLRAGDSVQWFYGAPNSSPY